MRRHVMFLALRWLVRMSLNSRAGRLLAASLSGLLFGSSFPPFGLEELIWVALVPLLWALQDVLRLAAAMTKKAAISGLQMGGGKAVIIGDPGTDKTRMLLYSMGELIDSLHGKYLAADSQSVIPLLSIR